MSSKMRLGGLKRLDVVTRYPAFLLTLGLAGWFEKVFTVEWSFPYCSSQEDGPASAVFGMPLPYTRWTGVSSLEYEFMSSIFILNILILSAVAFPFVSWVVGRVAPTDRVRRRNALGFAGLVLLLGHGALSILLLQAGFYRPVPTIASGYETYGEFRPIRFTFKNLRYDCTPSPYWFKDGWRPGAEKAAGATH